MTRQEGGVPIIRLWDVLLVPIQGELLDQEAELLRLEVLARIHDEGAAGLILDLSGVWTLDSHLCSVVVHLSRAARLLGTVTLVCGLSPEVALTVQSMGLDLAAGRTTRSLGEALSELGIQPTRATLTDEHVADLELGRRLAASES